MHRAAVSLRDAPRWIKFEMIAGPQLRTLRQKARLSLKTAAAAIGISEAHMSRLETSKAEPTLRQVEGLARLYGVPIHSLIEDKMSQLEAVTVQGAVSFGRLATALLWQQDQWYSMLVPPSTQYPGVERRAFKVEGSDMDLVFPDGSLVLFIDPPPVEEIGNHRYVIVVREHDSGLLEQFARQIRREEDGTVWLWPCSSNPRHQQPLVLRSNGNHLRVTGLIIGTYKDV